METEAIATVKANREKRRHVADLDKRHDQVDAPPSSLTAECNHD